MYLNYVEPLTKNSKTGEEALIILRDKGKTVLLKKEIPHIAITKPFDKNLAGSRYQELKYASEFEQLRQYAEFKLKPYFKKKALIWAYGSRKMKSFLPKYFHKREYSPMQMLHYRFPILSKILNEDRIKIESVTEQTLEQVLDEVMSEKIAAIDIENHIDSNEIYSTAFFTGDSSFGNCILHLFPLAQEELTVESEFGKFSFYLKQCKNDDEIGSELNRLIHLYDPFVLALHWGQHDLGLLTALSGKISSEEKAKRKKLEQRGLKACYNVFAPGIDYSKARIQGSKAEANEGRPTKMWIAGCQVYDGAGISQYFHSIKNNKLATKTAYWHDIPVEKDDYLIIDAEAKQARFEKNKTRKEELSRKRLAYNARDTIYTYFNYEKEKLPIFLGMMLLNVDMSQLCMSDKGRLVKERWKEKEFKRTKTFFYPTIEDEQVLSKLDMKKEKFSLLQIFKKEKMPFRRGLFDVHVLYPTFLIKTLEPIIRADVRANFIYKKMQQSADIDTKIMLAQELGFWLSQPWHEYKKFMLEAFGGNNLLEAAARKIYSAFDVPTMFSIRDFLYGQKFFGKNITEEHERELTNANITTINRNLIDNLMKFNSILKDLDMINNGKRFFYVKVSDGAKEKEALKELVKSDLAFYFGRAKALSVERGRATSALEGKTTKIITEGIELGTKSLPQRSAFEKQAIEDFFTIVLTESKDKAKEYIKWMAQGLAHRFISKDQLYFETREARLNWFDYLAETDRIKAFKKYKIMEGDSFSGVYAKDKEGMSQADTKTEIDWKRYQKKFYTTMKPFVEAAFSELTKKEIEVLLFA